MKVHSEVFSNLTTEIEHNEPISQGNRFLHVVRDKDYGLSGIFPDTKKLYSHLFSRNFIQMTKGLIH
tara:strand:+ start:654 stop:854 length:201 start_codon:yes stop_codon:yes gene_type:complete